MRARVLGTALVLSVVAPAVLAEAGLGALPGAEAIALAQADPTTEVARQRFEEGVKLLDAGRYDDARAAFLQAYALKRHPAVLLNLGTAELKSNRPDEGGNHLQQFLRQHTAATAEQKAAAEKGIAEAKKKTAFLIVVCDVLNADVTVDGTAVGKTPMMDVHFVKPGKHSVVATHQGKSVTVEVDAKAGSATPASLALAGGGPPAPTPAPGAAPAPAPGAPAGPEGASPAAAPAATPLLSTAEPPGDTAAGDREPFFSWYTRKPIAWVGTGVTAIGIAGGVAFSIFAASANASATDLANKIVAHAETDPATNFGETKPCARSGTGDLRGYEQVCQQLRDDQATADTDTTLAVVGFAVAGAGLIGTVAYAMIDWFPNKTPTTAAASPRLAVTPLLSPGMRGLGLSGTF